MNANKGPRRYKYVTQPLSRAEAGRMKKLTLIALQEQIDALQDEIDELEETMHAVTNEPLAKERTIQVTLWPGDEGYEEASPCLDVEFYNGDFEWINNPPPCAP